MILCARSTSRSSEQSTKHRSRREINRKVCSFYSQNNKIVWLSNMADTFFVWNSRGAQRFVGFFSWLRLSDADWLGGLTLITRMENMSKLVIQSRDSRSVTWQAVDNNKQNTRQNVRLSFRSNYIYEMLVYAYNVFNWLLLESAFGQII